MSVYTSPIVGSNDMFSQSCSAGGLLLTISFQWSYVSQEIYDDVVKQILLKRNTLPLIDKSTNKVIREYDYFTYWLTVPTNYNDIITWLSQENTIPYIPGASSDSYKVQQILQESTFAQALFYEVAEYGEQLYWMANISINGQEIHCTVRPGAIIDLGNNITLSFISDRDSIGRDELQYVTIKVEVPDGSK